ncbi:MAG TPA: ABC transporter permease [Ktedonobacterales bacterium]|nr:ABC transporter permease [Ktedonobacterales bacterium]
MRYTTTMSRNALPSFERPFAIARAALLDFAILAVSYLIATYFRQTLPIGKYVGTNYEWYSARIYLTIALGVVVAQLFCNLVDGGRFVQTRRGRLAAALLSLAVALVALTVLLPYQSGLQKSYFAICALALLLLIVPVPVAAHSEAGLPTMAANLTRLWANRALLRIWVQYNVQSRYAQAFLGILWIILLPLSSALVMNIVFGELLRVSTGDAPYISFLLVGLVSWGLFSQAISAGMRSILNAMGLVNQIYFPREIIVLSALGEAIVDAFFMFVATIVIGMFVGVYPNLYFALLPLLIVIQLAFSLGLMFIVSWLSVLVRDVPQLVSVGLQIIFYLCPIIYPTSVIPERFRPLIMLNPLAALMEAYRAIMVYHQPPHFMGLLYPAALGIGFLVFGYRLFKTNEDRFADMV